MQNMFSNRMQLLGTETAFEMLAKAQELERQGKEIIHLEIGEPNFPTPVNITEAGIRALQGGMTKYTPAPGLLEPRQAIAAYISKTRGIPVEPEEVVLVTGGKPIMFYSILATVNPGDEVIYPNPGFPIYESMIRFVGGKPIPIPLREENSFQIDITELNSLITDRTKMLILNSPQNPTGSFLAREDIEAIAEKILGRDIWVLSDEIYEKILYEGEMFSISSVPGMKEKTIILNGFSKSYSMTGWRLGYGVMNRELAEKITRLVVNSTSCVPGFIQMAGLEAITGPQTATAKMVEKFKERRNAIVAGLNAISGVTCLTPPGAFYVFPNIKSFKRSSDELAEYLLYEAGVSSLGGQAFGAFGEGYLRLSYANSLENIKHAIKRIENALAKL
ncbi:pyridoxal phosphate-dependent aminotransferase [Desulfitobacterium sp.]|uniref:pyridoxal phosphate-dependent aminotransferase n=1 Tax=Desulfitobacterium sp. TaxID=49981 RepID=UPI002C77F99A|nr:pyridoxal phosphate-dependent aminotransferase [Desulfitobacterium sp.]HVJ49003.1 pyridoxal phosphate-dependent aminotransferase [Desulfitobacterium sp.]